MKVGTHKISIKRLAECPAKAFFGLIYSESGSGGGAGRETHLVFRDVVRQLWRDVVFEKSVLIPLDVGDWGLMGSIDVFVPEETLVVEVKSAVKLPDKPEYPHLLQLNAYLHWARGQFGSARGLLVYVLPSWGFVEERWIDGVVRDVSAGGGLFARVFWVDYSEELFEVLVKRALSVIRVAERGEKPVKLRGPWCLLCTYRWVCEGEGGSMGVVQSG